MKLCVDPLLLVFLLTESHPFTALVQTSHLSQSFYPATPIPSWCSSPSSSSHCLSYNVIISVCVYVQLVSIRSVCSLGLTVLVLIDDSLSPLTGTSVDPLSLRFLLSLSFVCPIPVQAALMTAATKVFDFVDFIFRTVSTKESQKENFFLVCSFEIIQFNYYSHVYHFDYAPSVYHIFISASRMLYTLESCIFSWYMCLKDTQT